MDSPPPQIYILHKINLESVGFLTKNWKPTHPRSFIPTNKQKAHNRNPWKLAPMNFNDSTVINNPLLKKACFTIVKHFFLFKCSTSMNIYEHDEGITHRLWSTCVHTHEQNLYWKIFKRDYSCMIKYWQRNCPSWMNIYSLLHHLVIEATL